MALIFFFFNDTATTEIYTLSLHDALPIFRSAARARAASPTARPPNRRVRRRRRGGDSGSRASAPPSETESDRKSTRLNSSHLVISYAVFCLKKKNTTRVIHTLLRINNALS